ncbi:hypothetical protein LDENG_00253030 [Lucifuga dentata]|nr:hypothetical protein LDENG_00253030 [Lucifuga dentata]
MDGAKNREILEKNLMKSAKRLKMGQKFIFQQDNDPKHKNRISIEAANSDLNPVENLWNDLKVSVHQENQPVSPSLNIQQRREEEDLRSRKTGSCSCC